MTPGQPARERPCYAWRGESARQSRPRRVESAVAIEQLACCNPSTSTDSGFSSEGMMRSVNST
jgi:hypothetical protein